MPQYSKHILNEQEYCILCIRKMMVRVRLSEGWAQMFQLLFIYYSIIISLQRKVLSKPCALTSVPIMSIQ